ncbi:unnamed protein product [Rangifer tarandus platyrhynchus]|uniref:Uncharacterized protein n=1 Tax=Rangifer tarandus platyrhynchus TaxID=3082113 RepID=A0AC59ZAU0_RANTA
MRSCRAKKAPDVTCSQSAHAARGQGAPSPVKAVEGSPQPTAVGTQALGRLDAGCPEREQT